MAVPQLFVFSLLALLCCHAFTVANAASNFELVKSKTCDSTLGCKAITSKSECEDAMREMTSDKKLLVQSKSMRPKGCWATASLRSVYFNKHGGAWGKCSQSMKCLCSCEPLNGRLDMKAPFTHYYDHNKNWQPARYDARLGHTCFLSGLAAISPLPSSSVKWVQQSRVAQLPPNCRPGGRMVFNQVASTGEDLRDHWDQYTPAIVQVHPNGNVELMSMKNGAGAGDFIRPNRMQHDINWVTTRLYMPWVSLDGIAIPVVPENEITITCEVVPECERGPGRCCGHYGSCKRGKRIGCHETLGLCNAHRKKMIAASTCPDNQASYKDGFGFQPV